MREEERVSMSFFFLGRRWGMQGGSRVRPLFGGDWEEAYSCIESFGVRKGEDSNA